MISNKQIVEAMSLLNLSQKKVRKFRLEEASEECISEIKMYGNKAYIEYCDGKNKNIIVSKNSKYIYDYFLRFEIENLEIEMNNLKIKFFKNSNIRLNMAVISIGEVEIIGSINNNYIQFENLEINTSDPSLLLEKIINIKIYFKSVHFSEMELVEKPIRYKLKNPIFFDGILIKNDKFDRLTVSTIFAEKILKLEEYISSEEKSFCEIVQYDKFYENLINGLKKKKTQNYKIIKKNKFYYMVYINNKMITRKDAFAYLNKKNKIKNKNKIKFLHPIIKRVYKILGHEKFIKLKFFIRNKLDNKPYRYYVENLEKKEVSKNLVLIEGFNGNAFNGSVLSIASKLSEEKKHEIIISAIDVKQTKKICKKYKINAVVVKTRSKKYYKFLLSAEYIFTDTTLPRFFIKQKGQKVINSWHGTPLKAMGKSMIDSPLDLANTQRNFFLTDKLIVSNDYTKKILENQYMLKNFKNKEILLSSTPRNSNLINPKTDNFKSKIKIVWMPTWRGVGNKNNALLKNIKLFDRMEKIIKSLSDKYDFYVNPHQMISDVLDLENYKMKQFPEFEDVYHFIADADILITDYSSIMFDFSLKNKKIILDIHDIEEYTEDRGIELDVFSLPFDIAKNSSELLNLIKKKGRKDYSKINLKYNKFDSINGTEKFLIEGFKAKTLNKKEENKKVLIYLGTLLTNGITTSALNLLSNLDKGKYNYFIFMPLNLVKMSNVENIKKVVNCKINYIASPAGIIIRKKERVAYDKFIRKLTLTDKENELVNDIFKRENKRLFNDIKFEHVIHFTGYDAYTAKLFLNMESKKHIFVHNDMKNELELRNNFNEQIILEYYQHAKTIDVVNEEVRQKLMKSYFDEKLISKVKTVHNTINFNQIVENSDKLEEYFDAELENILNDKNTIKFINIARFSPEKGIDRLINAFNEVSKINSNKKMVLFLIGGHGSHKEMINGMINMSPYKKSIFMYENINPLPILKKANLFVLSSFYEGLPMVFFESLVLNVPILSTDIPGPAEFLKKGYGNLCENSTEGLITGIQQYIDGNLDLSIKSLVEFNKQAVKEFEEILK